MRARCKASTMLAYARQHFMSSDDEISPIADLYKEGHRRYTTITSWSLICRVYFPTNVGRTNGYE